MQRALNIKLLYGSILFCIAIFLYALYKEIFVLFLFPFALLIFVSAVYRLDRLFFFTVFCTPLAVNLAQTGLGIGVSLPTEPLIFGMMLVYLIKLLLEGDLDKRIVFHPVSLAILFHVFWMFFTSISSTMILVSVKYSTARLCYVVIFYYFSIHLFRDFKNIYRFAWCYVIPLLLVIGYTTFNHAIAGFTEKAAHISMVPFYNDHTAYAMALALFLPLLIALVFNYALKPATRFYAALVSLVFLIATVLSYTRAAWLGLIVALLSYFVFLFRIKTWLFLTVVVTMLTAYFVIQSQVEQKLSKNKKESSTDYADHVQSITNIKTDASNVERINRWNCALRLFEHRPLLGWGPGTYMFQYGNFQKNSERSYISVNDATGGNAHSEYLGPLAEEGVLGTLAFVLIAVITIYRSSRLIISTETKEVRAIAIGALLGLITYWIHGFLNNFLDTDKASVPFWGFIAILVSLELFHHKKSYS